MVEQETKLPSVLIASMNYGALLGISLVIISLIFYVLGKGEFKVQDLVYYVVAIGAIVFGIRNFRDNKLGGVISYRKSLYLGTLIPLFGSIIFGFAYYIYIKFVDSSVIITILDQTEQSMIDQNYPQDQIDTGMYYSRKFAPFIILVTTIIQYTFAGFIFSLFISIFMKRKEDSLDGNLNSSKDNFNN